MWLGRAHAYGGGIFLAGVADGVLEGNDAQHQQNGILMYGCQNMRVTQNNASFNSGYGLMLFESSQNVVEENTADFFVAASTTTTKPASRITTGQMRPGW